MATSSSGEPGGSPTLFALLLLGRLDDDLDGLVEFLFFGARELLPGRHGHVGGALPLEGGDELVEGGLLVGPAAHVDDLAGLEHLAAAVVAVEEPPEPLG